MARSVGLQQYSGISCVGTQRGASIRLLAAGLNRILVVVFGSTVVVAVDLDRPKPVSPDSPSIFVHGSFDPPVLTAERRLQRTIATRFGLAPEQPESVGDADRTILRVEIRDLLTSINASQPKRAPQKDKLAITAPWPPRVAEARFLSRFRELCRKV